MRRRLARAAGRHPDDLTHDTDLRTDLTIDSLDVVEMLIEVEDRFGIIVPDQWLVGMTTVGDVIRVLAAIRSQ